jgi:ABC-type transport system substrate-binding protein
LYEQIAATGTAIWIHRTWRIYKFTIKDFTQPQLGDPSKAIEELREAGLKAWDDIENPDAFVQELRS